MEDIVKSSNCLKFILYADNTCVFRSDSDINKNIIMINQELLNVKKWMQANYCLNLNFKKIVTIYLSEENKESYLITLTIFI